MPDRLAVLPRALTVALLPMKADVFLLRSTMLTAPPMLALAWWLHRPETTLDLVSRLGATGGYDVFCAVREALIRSLLPSGLFLLTIALAARTSLVPVEAVLLVLVVAVDLRHSLRVARTAPGFVPVWEERRPSAVPMLRALLAGRGIASETTGMGV